MLVVLDSGPVGSLCNPRASELARATTSWAEDHLRQGNQIVVPEIADYEVRRELLRASLVEGVRRLDALVGSLGYLPLTTSAMQDAAQLWADSRNRGLPTAPPSALDGDVILAAQARALVRTGASVVVATTNAAHLGRYVEARLWSEV